MRLASQAIPGWGWPCVCVASACHALLAGMPPGAHLLHGHAQLACHRPVQVQHLLAHGHACQRIISCRKGRSNAANPAQGGCMHAGKHLVVSWPEHGLRGQGPGLEDGAGQAPASRVIGTPDPDDLQVVGSEGLDRVQDRVGSTGRPGASWVTGLLQGSPVHSTQRSGSPHGRSGWSAFARGIATGWSALRLLLS